MTDHSTKLARLTNAHDEAAERLEQARLHTPGGQLTEAERAAILRSVARAYGCGVGELEAAR